MWKPFLSGRFSVLLAEDEQLPIAARVTAAELVLQLVEYVAVAEQLPEMV